jgi:acetyl CoA:N6-hydroxylysine acetyl transferase
MVWRWWNADHVRGKWSMEIRLGPPRPEGYSALDLASYLERLLAGDGHVLPVIGMLDGVDMSYIEVYDVGASPLADHPELGSNDRGIHLIVGEPDFIGKGLITVIGMPLVAWQFATHPLSERVVVEPDAKNARAIRAAHSAAKDAGVQERANVQLKHKMATLLFVERSSFAALGGRSAAS